MEHCVYLITYHGNKLPMFYIGKGMIKRIEDGYMGSVASQEYRKIWEDELENNRHLFRLQIVKKFETDLEAKQCEERLQRKLNVIQSSMYVNMAFSSGVFGISPSAEKRAAISKVHKGKTLSDEHKAAISKGSKGKIWVTDGANSAMVFPDDIPEGFTLGRVFSEEALISKRKHYENYVVSDETKAKISAAGKGRKMTEETKKKMSDTLKGRTFSEESKQKMSESQKKAALILHKCPHCNKDIAGASNFSRWHGDNCKLNQNGLNDDSRITNSIFWSV